jgi:dipeptidyl aminopeptidase/acylaminoacyl peptidase
VKRHFLAAALAIGSLAVPAYPAQLRPFTVDDGMKLRSIVDVRISPDGNRVAYVVSTPSLARNEHEAALYVVPSRGGAPARLGESIKILNTPLPAPRLRWSPDGSAVGVLYQPAQERESMRRNLEWFKRWIPLEPASQ